MAELGLARVRATTTAALPNNTLTGNVLTATGNGALTAQDGVTLVAADSVLVRHEADARKNGRYVVTSLGSAGTPWVLTRHSEADTSGEARAGMSLVFVEQGSVPGRVFALATTGTITLNTTLLAFIEVTSFIKTQPLAALEDGGAINLRDAGARGDNVADDSGVLQAVLAAASCTRQRVVVPAGHYRCSSQIKIPDGCYVDLELQHGAHLDFSTATTIPAREACLTFGTHNTNNVGPDGLTPLPGLTTATPVVRGDLQIKFAATPALQAGDLFIIVDPGNGSWNVGNAALQSARYYYRAGDYCRARSGPVSNVVKVDRQLFDGYAGGGIQLYKVTTNRVQIHGAGKITAPGLGVFDSAIHVQNGYRCRIEGIEIVGARYAHVEFWRCYESDIVNVKTATWNPEFNEGAGVFMISCYDCWVRGGSLRNGKHGLSLTGGDLFCSVPNRLCGAIGAMLKADTDAADMHGHTEHCGFYDCIIEGGVSLGGNYSTLSGCTVFTNSDNYEPASNLEGLGIRFRELKGASHTIKNVELIVNQVASNGVYPVALDCYHNVLGGTVVVENLTIRSAVWNPTVMYLNTERTEMADLVDVVVDGLRYEGPEAPTGERAPTLAIRCGLAAETGYRSVLIKDTVGVSPQCDNAHARLIEFRGVRCDDSPTVGAFLAAAGPSYAHTQVLKAVDCHFHDNKAAGLWVHGGAVGNDVYAIVENTTSINNGQTGSGADSTSLKVTQLKQLLLKGNTWGDTQGSPTQDGLVSLDTVTTVKGSGNQTIGTIHYGSTASARLLTSVTNDLELIELVGTGSPEGVQHAPVGTTYTRRDGLSGPVRYVKGPGTSNTGWRAEYSGWESGALPTLGKLPLIEFVDHFGNAGDALGGVQSTVSGSGAAVSAGAPPPGRFGVLDCSTGTTASGVAGLMAAATAIQFGGGRHRLRWDVSFVTLSTNAERYLGLVGFIDSAQAASTDGAYFRYVDTVNSGNWVCVTASNGIETATTTSTSLNAGNFRSFEIEVNAAGSEVKFYIDGALVATNTTNIPTGVSRLLGIGASIAKTFGTTARTLQADLVAYAFNPTASL